VRYSHEIDDQKNPALEKSIENERKLFKKAMRGDTCLNLSYLGA
jgi:hypothetical protein